MFQVSNDFYSAVLKLKISSSFVVVKPRIYFLKLVYNKTIKQALLPRET